MTTPDAGEGAVAARVGAAYRRIAGVDRPEVWITLRSQADALAEAGAVAQRHLQRDGRERDRLVVRLRPGRPLPGHGDARSARRRPAGVLPAASLT